MTWVVCGIDGLRVRVGKFSVGLGSEVVLGTGVVLGGNVVFGVGVLSGVENVLASGALKMSVRAFVDVMACGDDVRIGFGGAVDGRAST